MLRYQLHHNQSASFRRPYEPGDVLVPGWIGEFPPCFKPRTDAPLFDVMVGLADTIFARHNRDDRPDALRAPSLSVGDVVTIGEVALSVASIGWVQVDLTDADIQLPEWSEP